MVFEPDAADDMIARKPEHPLARAAVDRALAPYGTLLPAEVIRDLGMFVSSGLTEHPVGILLLARLSPGIRADVAMSEDPAQQGFQGFAHGEMLRALLRGVRKRAYDRGERRFLMPDTPIVVYHALLGYLTPDDWVWSASEDQARTALEALSEAMAAALFLGLMTELQADPSQIERWGEAGGAVAEVLPRLSAALRDARSRMRLPERQVLNLYEACGWDPKRFRQRMRHRPSAPHWSTAFLSLGHELAAALDPEERTR